MDLQTTPTYLAEESFNRSAFSGKDIFKEALYYALSPKEQQQIKDAKEKAIEAHDMFDAVSNPLQGWGGGTGDLTYNTLSVSTRRALSWQFTKQDSIMRDIPYFDKASSWKATRALMNGIDLNSKTDEADLLNSIKTELQCQFPALHSVIKLGDFYGMSGGLIFIKGCITEEDWKSPLKIADVAQNSFMGVRPLTRLYQIMPDLSGQLVTEKHFGEGIYSADEVGQPLYFWVNLSGDQEAKNKYFRVHRSRLLLYNSIELSWIEKRIEMFGGPSLLERCYTDFARYESLLAQINKLAQRSNIPILNLDNLPQASLQSTAFVNRILDRIKTINYTVSSGNMVLLGHKEKEQFKYETASFGELKSILEHYRENLSASLEAPTGVLFNDKEDKKDEEPKYLIKVKEIQDRLVRVWFRKLIPIIYKSQNNKQIDRSFSFVFKSLEVVSENDKADRFDKVVKTLHVLYEDDVIDVLSYQRMLKVAMENISDIPHEITVEYIDHLIKQSKDEPVTKSRRDIEVAIALNHAEQEGGVTVSNKRESARKGKDEGGNPKEPKKPTVKVPIDKNKPKEQ